MLHVPASIQWVGEGTPGELTEEQDRIIFVVTRSTLDELEGIGERHPEEAIGGGWARGVGIAVSILFVYFVQG